MVFLWLPSAFVVDTFHIMPQPTTRTAKKQKPQKGMSVKIMPETYGRIEAMKAKYPALRFDDCIRVALNAWDVCSEGVRNDCVLSAVTTTKP